MAPLRPGFPTAVVTGGTRGIGLEVVKGLLERGFRVVAVGRDAATGSAAVEALQASSGAVTMIAADLAEMNDVRRLAATISSQVPVLDLLIHNAAVVEPTRRLTSDGFERQFAVNHLAVFLLTASLFPSLVAGGQSRIVVTASQVERQGRLDFDDLTLARTYDASKAYSRSKLANMLFTFELARRVDHGGLTINCLHPGVVRTGLLEQLLEADRRPAQSVVTATLDRGRAILGNALRAAGLRPPATDWALSPAAGARTTLHLATAPELRSVSGQYFVDGHSAQPSEASRDPDLATRLWNVSAELVGVPPTWARP